MPKSPRDVCGWRSDLKSDRRGEFWIDREVLTEKMSQLTPGQRAMLHLEIVEKFNRGLDEILNQDQTIGEMREDFRQQ
jgi:hypothetical protein